MSLLLFFAGTGTQVTPPSPTLPVVVSGGAGSYPSAYNLTQRLTRSEWLRLLYPNGMTLENLSEQRLREFLEDDDLGALLLL